MNNFNADEQIRVSGSVRTTNINTTNVLNVSDINTNQSPIDEYESRSKNLMKSLGLFSKTHTEDAEKKQLTSDENFLLNLVLLGAISNVESYVRALIRNCLSIDKASQHHSLNQQLSFAAALHMSKDVLAHALMDDTSFSNSKKIKDCFNKFLNITISNSTKDVLSGELNKCLVDFDILCQIRHCIVHRSGMLATKTAATLGIESHKDFLEGPILLTIEFIQDANSICSNLVRAINNYIFLCVIKRYIKDNKSSISGDYRTDKSWFKLYLNTFKSTKEIGNFKPSSRIRTYDNKIYRQILKSSGL